MADDPTYPAHLAADVVLADGGTVHLRPIRATDAERIEALHGRLSAETIYFRFFSPLATLSPKLLERFVHVDYVDRLALVALLGPDIIAVGRYERLPSGSGDEAEVAFLVDDTHQGRGLGTVLLEHLAGAAREAGIARFVADTLPENVRMLRVFHEAGFDDERRFADGVVRVAFSIRPTEASESLAHERERLAAARSMRRLLGPRSVAVIGASRRPGQLGHQVLRRLLEGGFNGPVYPVHTTAAHVASIRAYPSVLEIPGTVDLAVVVVPAADVARVVDECARKHVGGLVVLSSGFAEVGPEGLAAERRLVTEARRNGMRLIGPNAMGVVNTDPDVALNATFSPAPPRGGVGFIAQSGGLGVVLLEEISRRGLGVSTFVSAGNKADVSGNDLLQYWDEDPATTVAAMYIESFGNPRTFARVAKRVSDRKPIVAVKSGRSAAGSQAAGQAGSARQDDAAVDALFRQSGVVRTDTLEELFDVAQVLASQPLPAGRRVAIVGNSGGPGVLAADACSLAGLEVAELAPATQAALAAALPGSASVRNPVGLAPDADLVTFETAVRAVVADPCVDALIVLYTSPTAAPLDLVAAAVARAAGAGATKPVVACIAGRRGLVAVADGLPVPSYAFPEAAAHALGRVADYADWRRRPRGGSRPLERTDPEVAQRIVAGARERHHPADPAGGDLLLDATEAADVLAAYGITATGDPQPAGTWSVGVGLAHDALFGPLVTVWWGTDPADAVTAVAQRALPITDVDAAELRAELLGHRPGGAHDQWADPAGGARLDELLERVGRLAEEVPDVAGLQLFPVTDVAGAGVRVLASVRVAADAPRPELAVRRLR